MGITNGEVGGFVSTLKERCSCLGLGEVVVEMIVSSRIHDTLLRVELLVWIY